MIGTLTGRMGDLGEQTLEAFFYGVGQFCFDTAKDMIVSVILHTHAHQVQFIQYIHHIHIHAENYHLQSYVIKYNTQILNIHIT